MQNIVDIIVSYATIWAPAVVAVGGILITVVKAIGTVKAHIDNMKEDTDFKDLKNEVGVVISENKELVRCNKLLLDELTKVHGFAEAKAKENK